MEIHFTLCEAYTDDRQYVSKINKQNFDLKLELFHRRQRAELLEAQVERLKVLEQENLELQQTNEDLLKELEKRDAAVQEAVEIICELEDRIEAFEGHGHEGTSFDDPDDRPEDTTAGTQPDLPSSPPHTDTLERQLSSQSKLLRREPSFLRRPNGSTSALRSLYRSEDGNDTPSTFSMIPPRPLSAFSRDEIGEGPNNDIYSLKSPSLSVLSESSFLSVYGRKEKDSKLHDTVVQAAETLLPEATTESKVTLPKPCNDDTRLKAWLESRDPPSRPLLPPSQGIQGRISTIGQVLHANLPKQKVSRVANIEIPKLKSQGQRHGGQYSPTQGGPIFGHHPLPPTPDTLTATNASATSMVDSSAHSSIIAEKSKKDVTPVRKTGSRGLHDYESSDGDSDDHPPGVVEHDNNESLRHTNSTRKLMNTLGLSTPEFSTPYGSNMMFNGSDYFPTTDPSARHSDHSHRSHIVDAYRRRSAQFVNTGSVRLPKISPQVSPPKANGPPHFGPQEWLSAGHGFAASSPTKPLRRTLKATPPASSLSPSSSEASRGAKLPTTPTKSPRARAHATLADPLRSNPVSPTTQARATLTTRLFRRSLSSTGAKAAANVMATATVNVGASTSAAIAPTASIASVLASVEAAPFRSTLETKRHPAPMTNLSRSSSFSHIRMPSTIPLDAQQHSMTLGTERPGTASSAERGRPRVTRHVTIAQMSAPTQTQPRARSQSRHLPPDHTETRARRFGLDGPDSDGDDDAVASGEDNATGSRRGRSRRHRRMGSFSLGVGGKGWGLGRSTSWRLGGGLGWRKGDQ